MQQTMEKDTQADTNHFIESAMSLGADKAVEFKTADIVYGPRTILKCMFGCSNWGNGNTCASRPGG
jgi:predicted metal-binding protein